MTMHHSCQSSSDPLILQSFLQFCQSSSFFDFLWSLAPRLCIFQCDTFPYLNTYSTPGFLLIFIYITHYFFLLSLIHVFPYCFYFYYFKHMVNVANPLSIQFQWHSNILTFFIVFWFTIFTVLCCIFIFTLEIDLG
jgi:hypothetical protein